MPNLLRVLAIAAALVLAACGSTATTDGPTETTIQATTSAPTDPLSSTEGTTTTAPGTTNTTLADPPTTASTTPTTLVPPIAEEDLPGEFFDLNPVEGSVIAVIGVAHDDVLNVRRGPGVEFEIVATLAPTSNEFVSTGRGRLLPNSIWYEGVTPGGVVGWVSSRFTAQLGTTIDLTSFVVEDLGGSIPAAADMEALGMLVAESQASTDPKSDLVVVVAPTLGDLGEITIDVVGLGDDAVSGIRLHVFGEPTDGGFSLKSVESTSLCVAYRGVTEDKFCV